LLPILFHPWLHSRSSSSAEGHSCGLAATSKRLYLIHLLLNACAGPGCLQSCSSSSADKLSQPMTSSTFTRQQHACVPHPLSVECLRRPMWHHAHALAWLAAQGAQRPTPGPLGCRQQAAALPQDPSPARHEAHYNAQKHIRHWCGSSR
jgi:hypothetical protein